MHLVLVVARSAMKNYQDIDKKVFLLVTLHLLEVFNSD